jgi:hypothetical protein
MYYKIGVFKKHGKRAWGGMKGPDKNPVPLLPFWEKGLGDEGKLATLGCSLGNLPWNLNYDFSHQFWCMNHVAIL